MDRNLLGDKKENGEVGGGESKRDQEMVGEERELQNNPEVTRTGKN